MQSKLIKNKDQIIEIILSGLNVRNFPEENIQRAVILAEYLRDCIFKLTICDENDEEEYKPVYIMRTINVLRQHLEVVWPSTATNLSGEIISKNDVEHPLSTKSIKNTLTSLQLIGDIVHIGNGFLLPTPVRLIEVPKQNHIALVGGWSTKSANSLFSSISQEGLGRLIKKENIPEKIIDRQDLWQPYKQWRGWEPNSLQKWTMNQLKHAERHGSGTLSSFENFEVFLSFQANRIFKTVWIRAEEITNTRTDIKFMLCRTGDRLANYFIGEFQGGKLKKEFFINDKETVSWLRLGLRLLHGKPSSALWLGNTLKIYSPLPTAIERQLLLYTYKSKTSEGTIYHCSEEYKSIIEGFLKEYGFTFKTKGGTVVERK
ncbi:hypothetical protein GW626_01510 [Peribacillus muralis]|uniref:hypothetical protein n=1 Tax=Peribacillus muralis TaxID=264697 RepID=UPI001F4EF2C8|nr:hypothetical protein [Peribacillus muralis]MCK1994912.1 hypothetical protein [Peribacillus muralis]MCK2015542.1 hypothetical protein [Peribacillus muralis]